MLERELKILLSEEQYKQLLNVFKWNKTFTQINNYFNDSNGELEESNITVRVREKENKISLQIKLPVSEQGSIHIKKEFEKELSSIPESIDRNILYDLCKAESLTYEFPQKVSIIGNLATDRKVCNWNDGIEICLDKNKYIDIVDYELEIEYKSMIDQDILDILIQSEVDINKTVKGKFNRFMNKYKEEVR